jgi:hypothetical protein
VKLVSSSDHPFYNVVGATVVGDQVVVANGGSHELLFYGRDGRLVRAAGRQGAGPGEFKSINWIQEVGGHLFAYDLQLGRLSEFSGNGEFVGSVSLRPPDDYLGIIALGVFPDHSLLVAGQVKENAARTVPILYRDTLALLRYDPQGEYRDSIGLYVWTERYAERWGRAGQVYLDLPLGRKSAIALRGWHYYVIRDDDLSITICDSAGATVDVLRKQDSLPLPIATREDVAAVRKMVKARFPRGADIANIADRVPIPSTLPPYGWAGKRALTTLRVDPDNQVWVLEFGGVRGEPPVWTVLGGDGSAKARVTAKEELDILYSDARMAIVHRWDPLDVESIELRRIAG